jgi:hypothetical protein
MHFINEFVSSLEPIWVVHISQYYLVFKNMNKGFDLLQIWGWKGGFRISISMSNILVTIMRDLYHSYSTYILCLSFFN